MWIIINKRHFVIFLDNYTHKSIKPRKKQAVRLQLNEKKSKESQTRLMSWYWKRKPTWRKDLITYNSHPWKLFSFNGLTIIWREGARLKLDVQGQGGGGILDVDGQRGWGGIENWTIFMDIIFVSSFNLRLNLSSPKSVCPKSVYRCQKRPVSSNAPRKTYFWCKHTIMFHENKKPILT